jgi:hypothetical protein
MREKRLERDGRDTEAGTARVYVCADFTRRAFHSLPRWRPMAGGSHGVGRATVAAKPLDGCRIERRPG